MNRNFAIEFENVKFAYENLKHRDKTLKGFVIGFFKGFHPENPIIQPQLQGVSLTISHGEQVGIIGRNGSGKSTLLKIIAGVLRPDFGEIKIDGSITPLMDLGTGMQPELSCVENIYLSGAYLGLSRKEVESYLKSILEWSELTHVANRPFHTLSTGMQSRLAFAVATCQTPEIVLIDELLSVGDIAFREKSSQRMRELRSNGSAVLIVSHDLNFLIQSVSRVIWIRDGIIAMDGDAKSVISAYEQSF